MDGRYAQADVVGAAEAVSAGFTVEVKATELRALLGERASYHERRSHEIQDKIEKGDQWLEEAAAADQSPTSYGVMGLQQGYAGRQKPDPFAEHRQRKAAHEIQSRRFRFLAEHVRERVYVLAEHDLARLEII